VSETVEVSALYFDNIWIFLNWKSDKMQYIFSTCVYILL